MPVDIYRQAGFVPMFEDPVFWLYQGGTGLLEQDEMISLPVGIAWGKWSFAGRRWEPNWLLNASESEQRAANLAAGFECRNRESAVESLDGIRFVV